jgi:hypothetical protein
MSRLRYWHLALCLMPGLVAAGAGVCSMGPPAAAYRATDDQSPTPDALDLARQMNQALAPGCTPNCPRIALLRNGSAGGLLLINAGAPGQWKLVYSPVFFSEVDESYGDAAVVAMLSHAFGHTLDQAMASAWPRDFTPELRADAWSGCALAQNSYDPDDVKSALAALAKFPPQSSPAWSSRVAALRLGYVKCAGDGARFDKLVK